MSKSFMVPRTQAGALDTRGAVEDSVGRGLGMGDICTPNARSHGPIYGKDKHNIVKQLAPNYNK